MDKRHERRAWRTLAADNTNVFDTGVFAEPLRDIINQGSLRGPWFSALWVDKTMSDTITLLCLVHGESSQHAFPIDITKNKLVGHLKQQIHKECHPQFEHVKAAKLTLWFVSMMMHHSKALCSMTRITTSRSYHLPERSAKSFGGASWWARSHHCGAA